MVYLHHSPNKQAHSEMGVIGPLSDTSLIMQLVLHLLEHYFSTVTQLSENVELCQKLVKRINLRKFLLQQKKGFEIPYSLYPMSKSNLIVQCTFYWVNSLQGTLTSLLYIGVGSKLGVQRPCCVVRSGSNIFSR